MVNMTNVTVIGAVDYSSSSLISNLIIVGFILYFVCICFCICLYHWCLERRRNMVVRPCIDVTSPHQVVDVVVEVPDEKA